ncbi:hypothetical protein [uncultured Ramlibacter sp.]|uniref:hypothetical protein n=1 Tax=uncultured Ramlibacter sp. TaxID=260755 RepID=UPI002638BB24|nr:hypothetical protein [uncultured Ramlibacter sp.]
MRMSPILWLAGALAALPAGAQEQACAASLAELHALAGGVGFPLAWEETGMADGKPMRVAILERDGALFLQFTKSGEGLWAESAGRICRVGTRLELRFGTAQVRLGPAAHWLLRAALGQGGQFTLTRLGPDRLHIATVGWSSSFAAALARQP